MDLIKRREEDKTKQQKELTEEDIQITKEQEQTGEVMDSMLKKEHYLRKNKDLFSDPSLLLYKLPLNKEQTKILYDSLVKKVS